MLQIFEFLLKIGEAGVGRCAAGRFEVGENEGFSRSLELAEGFFKFFGCVHPDFGVSQQHEKVGGLDEFVVLALRTAGRHAGGKVFPNVEMEENAFVEPGFAFPVDFDFELLAFGFEFVGGGEKNVDFFHVERVFERTKIGKRGDEGSLLFQVKYIGRIGLDYQSTNVLRIAHWQIDQLAHRTYA